MPMIARTLDEALAPITDGCVLAVPRESSGVADGGDARADPARRQAAHLVALPTSSLQADLLIGAGCVETLETSAVSLGEFGPAPRFTAAVLAGTIAMKDATCPALHAAFQAAEKGVPFMPLRGLIGSDVLKHRPDWKVIDNPFGDERSDRAAAGDQARRRAVPCADGRPRRQCLDRPPARARHHGACRRARPSSRSRRSHDGNLLDDPTLAAGMLPGFYVEAIAVAERGAWPLPLPEHYAVGRGSTSANTRKLAATDERLRDKYLDQRMSMSRQRRALMPD